MKTTKHIKSLATKINTSSWLSNESVEELLTDIKSALLKGKFYARVASVSRSGMSRKLELAYIKNNNLYHITNDDILKLAGIDKRGNINGCGMDMIFHAQYCLFSYLCPKHRYQDSMQRYNQL